MQGSGRYLKIQAYPPAGFLNLLKLVQIYGQNPFFWKEMTILCILGKQGAMLG